MPEPLNLLQLRAALARAVNSARQNPADPGAVVAVDAARAAYAEARAVVLISKQIDGVPLTLAARRRIADAVLITPDTERTAAA